jgi:aldehyde dehydrogenase (NAD+)
MVNLERLDKLFINGGWIPLSEARTQPIVNPATEQVIGYAPVGTIADAEQAMQAAREAFDHGSWPMMKPTERAAALQRLHNALSARAEEIIALIIAEAGATSLLARYLHFGIALKHAQTTIDIMMRDPATSLPIDLTMQADGTTMLGAGVVVREPVGVVTAITAYNFPFFLNVGKAFQALAAGCTLILKPSPYTPFQALIIGEAIQEAGLPAGVFNIVTGDVDVAELLTTDPRIDLVTFTGSETVGATIQRQAAPTLKRCLLELGGKSALIVREDADLPSAVLAGGRVFTVHAGQGCALLTRHIVHNSVRAEYVEQLKALAGSLKIGNPADASVKMGPLIRESQREKVRSYTDIALSEGARLVCGGRAPAHLDKGFFYEPTLFDDAHNSMRVAREEIFGPIGVVIGYDDDDEAIAIANDSDLGLAGGIFSRNVGKAYEMALKIRTGGVEVNGGSGTMSSHAPFGGIKRSGYGREYGLEGLNEFTYLKTISFHAR